MKQASCKSLRINHLLELYYANRPKVFAERAVLATQAYAQTEGQPMLMRRAKMLWNILDKSTVLGRDGELVIGCKTPAILGSSLYPEIACDWVNRELDTIALREEAPFDVSAETSPRYAPRFLIIGKASKSPIASPKSCPKQCNRSRMKASFSTII